MHRLIHRICGQEILVGVLQNLSQAPIHSRRQRNHKKYVVCTTYIPFDSSIDCLYWDDKKPANELVKRGGAITHHNRLQLLAEHDDMPLTPLHTVVAVVKPVLAPNMPTALLATTQGEPPDMDGLVQQLDEQRARVRDAPAALHEKRAASLEPSAPRCQLRSQAW